jgi:tetratricopeptide (TPR) repeat protein
MRQRHVVLTAIIALGLGLAGPALAKAPNDAEALAKAAQALGSDPAKAVKLVDPIIARSGAMTPADDTVYSCSDNLIGALSSLVTTATPPRKAVVYNAGVCDALFIKGFSMIDMKRGGEAEPFLRRATELAPANAHYLNEYAEWHKSARQWQTSYDLFAKAADLAPQQPVDVRDKRHARSLRGMGFNLIEMGKLEQAEALMNQSLKLEPDSQAAKNELQYIAEQRAKTAPK